MVTAASSSQVPPLSSLSDYERARTNVNRIEKALDVTNQGQAIVGGLKTYTDGLSRLVEQVRVREDLGIEKELKEPHNELRAKLERVARSVVEVAAKVTLDAAIKAASTPKSPSILRSLTLGQWKQIIEYGTVAGAAMVFAFFAREFVWRWMKEIPSELPTIVNGTVEAAKEVAQDVASAADTAVVVVGSALAGLGDVVGGVRNFVRDNAPSSIAEQVPPSPTTLSGAIRTSVVGIASQIACSIGLRLSLGWVVKSTTGYALPTQKICAPFVAWGMFLPKPAVLVQWAVNQTREYPKTTKTVRLIGRGIVAGGIVVRGAERFVPAFRNALEPQPDQVRAQAGVEIPRRAAQEPAIMREPAPPAAVPPGPLGEGPGAGADRQLVEALRQVGDALQGAGAGLRQAAGGHVQAEEARQRAEEAVRLGGEQRLQAERRGAPPQPAALVPDGEPPPQAPPIAPAQPPAGAPQGPAPTAEAIAQGLGATAVIGQAQGIKRTLQVAAATVVVAATAGGVAIVAGAGMFLSGAIAVTAGGAAVTIGATKVVLVASRLLLGPRGWNHLLKN